MPLPRSFAACRYPGLLLPLQAAGRARRAGLLCRSSCLPIHEAEKRFAAKRSGVAGRFSAHGQALLRSKAESSRAPPRARPVLQRAVQAAALLLSDSEVFQRGGFFARTVLHAAGRVPAPGALLSLPKQGCIGEQARTALKQAALSQCSRS